MKYQVGDLLHYEDDDPQFDALEVAIKHAAQQSYDDRPWGIWTGQNDGGELLVIVYMQEVFRK